MRFVTPLPLACVLLSLVPSLPVSARVGETQEEFERRLFQPFVGKFIPREKTPDPFKEAEVLRQQPFNDIRELLPPGIREGKYWKSAVPNVLSNDDGWRVYVFYHDNRSAFEAYQRVGDVLSPFEIKNILRANQGDSEWQQVEPDSLETKASGIGCTYQLADGSLRAKVVGNWLMVFSTKLDAHVKEQQRINMERQIARQRNRLKRQESTADGSTSGF